MYKVLEFWLLIDHRQQTMIVTGIRKIGKSFTNVDSSALRKTRADTESEIRFWTEVCD